MESPRKFRTNDLSNKATHTTSANARLFDNEPLEIKDPRHGDQAQASSYGLGVSKNNLNTPRPMPPKKTRQYLILTLILTLKPYINGQTQDRVETSTTATISQKSVKNPDFALAKRYYHRDEGPPCLEADLMFCYDKDVSPGDILVFMNTLMNQQIEYYNEINPDKEILSLEVYDVYDGEDYPDRHIKSSFSSMYSRLDNVYGLQTGGKLIVKIDKSTVDEGRYSYQRVPRTYLVYKVKDTDQAEGDQLIRQIELAFTNGGQYPLLDVPGHELIVGQPILVYAETGIPLPLSATESVVPLRTFTPATLHCLIEANPPRLKLTADAAEDSVPSADRTSWFEYRTSNDLISWTPINQDALLEDQSLELPLTTIANEKIFAKAFKVVESETYNSSGMIYGRY